MRVYGGCVCVCLCVWVFRGTTVESVSSVQLCTSVSTALTGENFVIYLVQDSNTASSQQVPSLPFSCTDPFVTVQASCHGVASVFRMK